MPIAVDRQIQAEMEALAQAIAGENTSEDQLQAALAVAEAHFDLKRIRRTRVAATPISLDERLDPRVLTRLCALDRYERLALGRRKHAVRQFDGSKKRPVISNARTVLF